MLLAVLALALAAASCGKYSEADPLEAIPASTRGVAAVNLYTAGANAGIADTDGKGGFAAPAGSPRWVQMTASLLATLGKGIDLNRVYVAADRRNEYYATAAITNGEALRKGLAELGATERDKTDGFGHWNLHGCRVLFSDRQVWFTLQPGFSPAGEIDAATDGSILTDAQGVADFLKANEFVSVAANTGAFPLPGSDSWSCVKADPAGNALKAVSRQMTSSGEIIQMKNLRTLDRSTLDNAPADWAFITAVGLDNNIDWSVLPTLGGMIGGFNTMGVLERLVDYLKEIDGTVLVAANPKGQLDISDVSLTDFDIMFAAQMPDDAARKAVATLAGYLRDKMFTVTSTDNSMTVNQAGFKIEAMADDGRLTISFGNPAGGGAPAGFYGNCLGVKLNIPRGLLLHHSSITVDAVATDTESTVTISLPGYNMPFVQSVISAYLMSDLAI